MKQEDKNSKEEFQELIDISARLRKECPWDAKQTLDSFYKYITEEAIEVQKAAEAKDYEELKEELGDVFWNVIFMANITKENGLFDIHDIIVTSKEKMIRRHPHVFGNASRDIESIYKKWDEIKAEEKRIKNERNGGKKILKNDGDAE